MRWIIISFQVLSVCSLIACVIFSAYANKTFEPHMVYVEEAPLEKWQVQAYLTALVFGVFGALGLFFGVWWSLWYKEKQQKVSEGEKTQQKKK